MTGAVMTACYMCTRGVELVPCEGPEEPGWEYLPMHGWVCPDHVLDGRAFLLDPLPEALAQVGREAEAEPAYALIGGAVLFMHGLRQWDQVGDVDVIVADGVYELLRDAYGWEETWPNEGDPPMLVRALDGRGASLWPLEKPVSAWRRWDEHDPMNAAGPIHEQVLSQREQVGGVWCQPLAQLRDWKVGLTAKRRARGWEVREKDVRDVDMITKHLADG